jgi:hypothetical protein
LPGFVLAYFSCTCLTSACEDKIETPRQGEPKMLSSKSGKNQEQYSIF